MILRLVPSASWRWIGPAVLVAAVLCAFAPPADAGQYMVDICKRWEDGAPRPLLTGVSSTGFAGLANGCGGNGNLQAYAPGGQLPYNTTATVAVAVPVDRPGLTLKRVRTVYSAGATVGSLAFTSLWDGPQSRLTEATDPVGRAEHDHVLASGSRAVTWVVYCSYSAGPTNCEWPANDPLMIVKARLWVDDSSEPSIAQPTGALTAQGRNAGVSALEYAVDDADSGVKVLNVKLGTTTVATEAFDCASPDWSPCPRSRRGTLSVDTTRVPAGTHPLTLVAQDAAGNTTTRNAGEVTVGNASSAPTASGPNGAGASPQARIHFSERVRRQIRMRFGKRRTLTGRLLAPGGAPIVGATIDVSSRLRAVGAAVRPEAPLVTDARGVFRYLVPAGASRRLRFSYRARLEDATVAHTTDVQVRVRAGVTFGVSRRRLRNGQVLRYFGRLHGPHVTGRFVEVQVRDGRFWRLVCAVRAGRTGRYRCRHLFRRTFSPTRYVFRARVRRQPGLPYDGAVTRRLAVVVRP